MNLCIYGAASNNIDESFLTAGENLGQTLAKYGHTVVFGGGANGMMGAVARGAQAEGGEIIGISPKFFDVDGILFSGCTKLIFTDTMRERKQLMEENSDAFIVTPGGIGTFDEFFEIYSLRQLKRHNKKIIIFNINGYFNPLIEMVDHAIEQKFVSKANRDLLYVCDTADEILATLTILDVDDDNIEDLRSIVANK